VTEHKLFEGAVPYVSTAAFHADRERAPHLEQGWHRPRLERAAEFVRMVTDRQPVKDRTVSDLGCGDGGLLSLLAGPGEISAWGYDFAPANAAGWTERGVSAFALDVFGVDIQRVQFGTVTVMTEVLEHLEDPHGVLRWVRGNSRFLVCSSPWNENQNNHCEEHAWAWDLEGYAAMIQAAGWTVVQHQQVGLFQVVLAG
jgi:SAM-dependent methyltransferase